MNQYVLECKFHLQDPCLQKSNIFKYHIPSPSQKKVEEEVNLKISELLCQHPTITKLEAVLLQVEPFNENKAIKTIKKFSIE